MLLIHLPSAAAQVQARRRREAYHERVRRRAVRAARAQQARPGALRQAVAFRLIEAGLRLLSARPALRRTAHSGRAAVIGGRGTD